MKGLFTFILAFISCSSAFAEGDNNYYWFYDRAEVATTGKGLIYLSEESECKDADYAETCEFKAVDKGAKYKSIFYHAKPTDGYQFIGLFPNATPKSLSESLTSNSTSNVISVTTQMMSESNVVEGYGFVPDTTFYAVFSKIYVNVNATMDIIGTADIDKVINDKGDEVTITATPTLDGCTFDYWMDSNGNKITENPYTFTVGNTTETYTAYFKGDKILNIDFGEGKFIPFSTMSEAKFDADISVYIVNEKAKQFYDENEKLIQFIETENAWGYYNEEEFVEYNGEIPEFNTNYKVETTFSDYYPNTGVILYGEGIKTIVLHNNTPEEQLYSIDTYLVGTASGAINIESLPKQDDNSNTLIYYVYVIL
ncbi:MAG: hypothetical protein K6E54_08890 [Bacteroidaceae bacterium]|nr:hypothetical protein [Bacteroidaceae bacterium]